MLICFFFFFSSRRRHTRWTGDWSSDVCSSDLKKVVLLDLDLRKARLSSTLGCEPSEGISDFLTSERKVDEFIKPVNHSENLYFISAGTWQNNPGELILNQRMELLFAYLKQKFD